MKNIAYIFVALSAFVVGVFVFFIRPLFISVPLCELRKNIEYYKSHKIKVKGFFTANKGESGSYYFLIDGDPSCAIKNVDWRFGLGLELPKEAEMSLMPLIKEITEKNDSLGETNFYSRKYGAEVELTGFVDEKEESMWSECCPSHVEVQEIKQISPIILSKDQSVTVK